MQFGFLFIGESVEQIHQNCIVHRCIEIEAVMQAVRGPQGYKLVLAGIVVEICRVILDVINEEQTVLPLL